MIRKATVLIGHSHVNAIALAAQAAGARLDVIAFWLEPGALAQTDGRSSFRPDLAQRVAAAGRVLSVIGGSAHSVLGLVEHHRPFDFVLPSQPDLPLDPGRELAPAEGVRAALAALDIEYGEIRSLLLRTATGPVIQLEPPPPVADSERIRPHVPWGLFPGRPQAVAPPWLRYKLWRLHCEIVAEWCAAAGVSYVRAPPRAVNGEGFLRPGLDHDGIHAGASYGAMVLEDLGIAA